MPTESEQHLVEGGVREYSMAQSEEKRAQESSPDLPAE